MILFILPFASCDLCESFHSVGAVNNKFEGLEFTIAANGFECFNFTIPNIYKRHTTVLYIKSDISDLPGNDYISVAVAANVSGELTYQSLTNERPGVIYSVGENFAGSLYYVIKNTLSAPKQLNVEFYKTWSSNNEYLVISSKPNDCFVVKSDGDADLLLTKSSTNFFTYINFYNGDDLKIEILVSSDNNDISSPDALTLYSSDGFSLGVSRAISNQFNGRYSFRAQISASSPISLVAVKVSSRDSSKYGIKYRENIAFNSLNTFQNTEDMICKSTDYSGTVITALVTAIIVYFSIIIILIILIIMTACIYPNRFYRAGFQCYCCYCCCVNRYSYSSTYYSGHSYDTPCYCNCFQDMDCDGGSSDDKGVIIVVLIVILLMLILIAVVLLIILYNMCNSLDEDEREFEKRGFRVGENSSDDSSRDDHYNKRTVPNGDVIILNVNNQTNNNQQGSVINPVSSSTNEKGDNIFPNHQYTNEPSRQPGQSIDPNIYNDPYMDPNEGNGNPYIQPQYPEERDINPYANLTTQ